MSVGDRFHGRVGAWMEGGGPEGDVVLGSRVRLARNVAGVPFPGVAAEKQLSYVAHLVAAAVGEARGLGTLTYVDVGKLSRLEQQLLVERHLVSPALIQQPRARGVVLRDDEALAILVNEEDHLRIQAFAPGLQVEEAWRLANEADDYFESQLDYAFSERFGYLTAWPTNLGTGMRASVMLHLPGLALTGQIRRMVQAVNQFGLTVRGLYGEGTDVQGNIYQLSNQVSLGHTEEEIGSHLRNVAREVIAGEREARDQLLTAGRIEVEDRVFRALGLLRYARRMSSQEALGLFSDVRLGIDLGLIRGLSPRILQELLVRIRPAHLQWAAGRDMGPDERDAFRAELVRQRIREEGKDQAS